MPCDDMSVPRHDNAVVFAMTYPDSEGNVWDRIVRLYDLTAAILKDRGIACLVAYPKLTGRASCPLQTLQPCEIDLRRFSADNRPRIEKFIRDSGIRVVVYMDMDPGGVPFRWLRAQRVRSVNFSQYNFADEADFSVARRIINGVRGRLGIRHHDLYISNSAHQHQFLMEQVGIPARRLASAVNGVDVDLFSPGPAPGAGAWRLPKSEHYAIMVCQARPEKRIDFLIDVAAEVFRRRPALSLTFMYVGDGGCRVVWEQKAAALGLADRFRFLGFHQDITPLYRLADVMLHAPSRESFGFVIAEAMACELPVVCSRVGGPREIVDHGKTGYLIDPADRDGFASSILRILDAPRQRQELGRAGRARVLDRFRLSRQAEDLSRIIGDQFEVACGRVGSPRHAANNCLA